MQDTLKKNDEIRVTISDLTNEGLGVGKIGTMAVFVKDTVIGDTVRAVVTKVKAHYAYARALEIVLPSVDRVPAVCPVARQCGGCQLQMMDYPAQLRFKEQKVLSCLMRIGHFTEEELHMEPIIGMEDPWHYRNKAQYPVGIDKSGAIIAGFYAGRTHSIIRCDDCMIGDPHNQQIVNRVIAHMNRFHIDAYDEKTGNGLMRHIMIRSSHDGRFMVCLVINGYEIPGLQELTGDLSSMPGMQSIILNSNLKNTNVILGEYTRTIWGTDYLEDRIGDILFRISARSFFQVNRAQTEKLYQTALSFAALTGHETVWDIYCGIGTISLFLAKQAGHVYGVEIVPEAIEDAKMNAELNGISNVDFYTGCAEEVLPEKYREENIRADVIVVDPPRKGCDPAVLKTITDMAPDRLVYVSCDPATLARDLRYLCDNGFTVEKVRPCDMFGQTVHVETVVLLSTKSMNIAKY